MGSKRVGLARTQALIENLKRELNMGQTTFTNAAIQGPSTSTAGAGAVSGSTTAPATRVTELNGETLTTITVDLQFLSASGGAQGVVIGNKEAGVDNTASAHLIQWSEQEYGVCYKVEMSCVEEPAQNSAAKDIDLKLSSDTRIQGQAADGNDLVTRGGNWAKGDTVAGSTSCAITDGHYVYLVNGTDVGNTGDAQYASGKYVIKFFGHSDF